MRLSVHNAIKWLPGNSRVEHSSRDTTKGVGKGTLRGEPKGKADFTGRKDPEAHLFVQTEGIFSMRHVCFTGGGRNGSSQPRIHVGEADRVSDAPGKESPDSEVMQIPLGKRK